MKLILKNKTKSYSSLTTLKNIHGRETSTASIKQLTAVEFTVPISKIVQLLSS